MVSIFDLNKELSKVPFADKLHSSRCDKLDARAGYVRHYTFKRFKKGPATVDSKPVNIE